MSRMSLLTAANSSPSSQLPSLRLLCTLPLLVSNFLFPKAKASQQAALPSYISSFSFSRVVLINIRN